MSLMIRTTEIYTAEGSQIYLDCFGRNPNSSCKPGAAIRKDSGVRGMAARMWSILMKECLVISGSLDCWAEGRLLLLD